MAPIQIVDEDTVAAIIDLAEQLQQTPEEAVATAVGEKLARIARLKEITRETAKLFPPGVTSTNATDWLYDENGLPK